MEKKIFVSETVKSVLSELAKGENQCIFFGKTVAGNNLEWVVDNLTASLSKAYTKHLISPVVKKVKPQVRQ